MKQLSIYLFLSFVFLGSLHAQIQEELSPLEKKQQTIVQEPITMYKGFFRTSFAANFSLADKVFDTDGKRISLPGNIWGDSWFMNFYLKYGITERLQASITLNYTTRRVFQSVQYEVPGLLVEKSQWVEETKGFGDISASVSYQILKEETSRPAIALSLEAFIPTGQKNPTNIVDDRQYNGPPGNGEFALMGSVRLRKINYPFTYDIFIDYRKYFGGEKIPTPLNDPLDLSEKPFKSGDDIYIGGSLLFHLNDWIAVRNYLHYAYSGANEMDEEISPASYSVVYLPGLSFQISQFRIDQVVSVPLFGKYITADPSYSVILQYTF